MQAKTVDEVVKLHDTDSKESVAAFKRDLLKMRTGRASASMVENIQVDYYGSRTPLMHLGQITAPEARTIIIQVYDGSAVESVDKALRTSDLNLNPSREANTLRINIPALTEETRRDIVKVLHKHAEEMRVSIRNHRRDANDLVKKFEKDSTITKDDSKRAMDKIQKQTDLYIQEIDKLLAAKEAECMEV